MDYGSIETITRPKLEIEFIFFINRFGRKDFEYICDTFWEEKSFNTNWKCIFNIKNIFFAEENSNFRSILVILLII